MKSEDQILRDYALVVAVVSLVAFLLWLLATYPILPPNVS